MTLREQYDAKLREYNEYRIQLGVYEAKLNTCRETLINNIQSLAALIPSIQDEITKTSIQDIVDIASSTNYEFTSENLESIRERIDRVCLTLEAIIQEALK